MGAPKGKLKFVRGEQSEEVSSTVSVRLFFRDEGGAEWFFNAYRFNHDLEPVVRMLRYYVTMDATESRGPIYRGTDGKRYQGCYICGLPFVEHSVSLDGPEHLPCPNNYKELLDKLVIENPEKTPATHKDDTPEEN